MQKQQSIPSHRRSARRAVPSATPAGSSHLRAAPRRPKKVTTQDEVCLPPSYKQIPVEMTVHEDTRLLPYHWLRDGDTDPDVKDVIEAENLYADRFMKHHAGKLMKTLEREFDNRLYDSGGSIPRAKGNFYYYERDMDEFDDGTSSDEEDDDSSASTDASDEGSSGEDENDLDVYCRVHRWSADAWAQKRLKKAKKKKSSSSRKDETSPTPSAEANNEQFPHDFIELCAKTYAADISSPVPRPSLGTADEKEEIILDLNLVREIEGLEEDADIEVQELAMSPDEQQLLAVLDWSSGAEQFVAQVYDIGSHTPKYKVDCDKCGEFGEWGNDVTFYYVRAEEGTLRPFQLVKVDLRNMSVESQPVPTKNVHKKKNKRSAPVLSSDDLRRQGLVKESIIIDEVDQAFEIVSLCPSEDDQYLFCSTMSNTSSELWFCRRDDPLQQWRVFAERQPNVEYDMFHHPLLGGFLVQEQLHGESTDNPHSVYLVPDKASAADATQPSRQLLLSCATNDTDDQQLEDTSSTFAIEEIDLRQDVILFTCRLRGFQTVLVLDLLNAQIMERILQDRLPLHPLVHLTNVASFIHTVAPPSARLEDIHTISVVDSAYDDSTFLVAVTNMVVPELDVRVARRSLHPDAEKDSSSSSLFVCRVCNSYKPKKYKSTKFVQDLIWVAVESSGDHTVNVPVFFCFEESKFNAGLNPLLLHTYGSYGDCCDPEFDNERLSLLERGVVCAFAGVRGGGEMGPGWRQQGNNGSRMNAFTDFIACAEELAARGICDKQKIVASGESAGGMIVASAATLRPDLFAAVHARVPFVDVLTTMLDETAPMTVGEWEEWGNPVADASTYALLKSYSPTDNVVEMVRCCGVDGRFPSFYIESGWSDTRVRYHEPLTWCATLRESLPVAPHPVPVGKKPKRNSALCEQQIVGMSGQVLLRCHMDGGHDGGGDEDGEEAFAMAFILSAVGITTNK